ncbi:MAG: [protein-PII] uridylyltransferase [Acetobacteraceae bacterium]
MDQTIGGLSADVARHEAPGGGCFGTLAADLAALPQTGGEPSRDLALSLFRRHLGRIQADTKARFEAGLRGLAAARLLASRMDEMVRILHDWTSERVFPPGVVSSGEALAVAATGGFGRGVLAPFSDLDLMFLTPWKETPRTEQVVEYMLYFLWDLGLKVGHATRSVDECIAQARNDQTVRTSLLDARFLAGDRPVFDTFAERFRADCDRAGAPAFFAAKRAERAERYRRYGDSAFLLEPNVKDGKGGLRDLQTLFWMMRHTAGIGRFEEAASPTLPCGPLMTPAEVAAWTRAAEFLWSVRFHLHYTAGRSEERLTFDLQPVIGAAMGYTRHGAQQGVERFMKHYFLTAREVRRLTLTIEPVVERAALGPPATNHDTPPAIAAQGFAVEGGKLTLAEGQSFQREPILLFRILAAARDTGREIHPLALRGIVQHARLAARLRDDAEANALFLDLLCSPKADGATWLAAMNLAGLLGRFIPDWARIVGQMQFDSYHVFTVDEHTVEAVRVLNQLERGELAAVAPVATALIGQLQSRRALYVAMLLHDIAKGRGGDHSEKGAQVAHDLGPRLGLSAEETETVSWLVLHHLVLSQTAFRRDIDDPKTILDLAELVQSPERLRLLMALTVADMRAVSSKVWNNWKATLLREIYWRVAEVLAGGLNVAERDVRVARARDAADEALKAQGWPDDARERFLGLGYPAYWLGFDPATHVRHARMVRESEATGSPLTVSTSVLSDRGVTEVTVYTTDHPGLFSKIAGALAVAGASIVDARIHTMTNGMALDTFWIQDASGVAFDSPHRIARMGALIEQALSGRIRLAEEMRKTRPPFPRTRAIHVPPRVVIDNHASATHTVVEVNGRDRPGLLHDITAAMSEQGLQIASAHVTTYGVRAVDVFYVKDVFGLKVENERKLATLKEALLAAIDPPAAPSTTTPSARSAA